MASDRGSISSPSVDIHTDSAEWDILADWDSPPVAQRSSPAAQDTASAVPGNYPVAAESQAAVVVAIVKDTHQVVADIPIQVGASSLYFDIVERSPSTAACLDEA